ncbi:MAG TPA: hypothetical protein VF772_01760, partial [Terriglobales bacterium]
GLRTTGTRSTQVWSPESGPPSGQAPRICVGVGMEATGHSRWFERVLAELGFELWIGDPAEIKPSA